MEVEYFCLVGVSYPEPGGVKEDLIELEIDWDTVTCNARGLY